MAKVGELLVDVLARTTGLQKGLKKGEQSLGKFKSAVNASIGTLTQLAGVTGGFAGLGFAVKLAADAEQAKVAFSTMLGSAEAGKRMFADLQKFAASTPLQLTTLQDASRTLLAFGVQGEQVIPTLRMLGDAAGGDAQRLQSLALVFGQVSSAGKLTGGDLLQMINAGFNPLNYIAKRTGETMEALRDRMSKGAIGIAEVKQAFQDATGPGGQFFQMMEKQSQTLAGRFSTFKDNVAALAMQIGEVLLPTLGKMVDVATQLVQMFTSLDKGTQNIIVQVGMFGAAFLAAIYIIPKVISVFRMLVGAYKALATAQAVQMALSGPKGWAILAGSAVAAGLAIAGVALAMHDVNKEMAELESASAKAAVNANRPPTNVNVVNNDEIDNADARAKYLNNQRRIEDEIKGLRGDAKSQAILKVARLL